MAATSAHLLPEIPQWPGVHIIFILELCSIILWIKGSWFFIFCSPTADLLSEQITYLPLDVAAYSVARLIARTSAVKIEQWSKSNPVLIVLPSSDTMTNETVSLYLEPSVKINFHPSAVELPLICKKFFGISKVKCFVLDEKVINL